MIVGQDENAAAVSVAESLSRKICQNMFPFVNSLSLKCLFEWGLQWRENIKRFNILRLILQFLFRIC